MSVFVDTNIVISAILFPHGKTARVFSYLLAKHTVIISSYIQEECKEVFEKKFPFKKELLDIFFDGISFEEFKSPEEIDEKQYPKIRDIKDLPDRKQRNSAHRYKFRPRRKDCRGID